MTATTLNAHHFLAGLTAFEAQHLQSDAKVSEQNQHENNREDDGDDLLGWCGKGQHPEHEEGIHGV